MLKLPNGWIYEPFNGVEDREEVPGDRNTLDRPERRRKRSPLPSTSQKHEGKAATKPSPKLQNLGHRSGWEQIHHAPGVKERSGGEALQDCQELTDNHVVYLMWLH